MAMNGFRGGEEVAVTGVPFSVRVVSPVVISTTGVGSAVVVAVTLGAGARASLNNLI